MNEVAFFQRIISLRACSKSIVDDLIRFHYFDSFDPSNCKIFLHFQFLY